MDEIVVSTPVTACAFFSLILRSSVSKIFDMGVCLQTVSFYYVDTQLFQRIQSAAKGYH